MKTTREIVEELAAKHGGRIVTRVNSGCENRIPPLHRRVSVWDEAHIPVSPAAYVQTFGRALRPYRYTYRHTKSKQPRCIRVKRRVMPPVVIDYASSPTASDSMQYMLDGAIKRPAATTEQMHQLGVDMARNGCDIAVHGSLYHHTALGTVRVSSIHPQCVTVRDRLGHYHDVKREELSTHE